MSSLLTVNLEREHTLSLDINGYPASHCDLASPSLKSRIMDVKVYKDLDLSFRERSGEPTLVSSTKHSGSQGPNPHRKVGQLLHLSS